MLKEAAVIVDASMSSEKVTDTVLAIATPVAESAGEVETISGAVVSDPPPPPPPPPPDPIMAAIPKNRVNRMQKQRNMSAILCLLLKVIAFFLSLQPE
jgi:hypothetical protein